MRIARRSILHGCAALALASAQQAIVAAAEPLMLWDAAVPLPTKAAAPVLADVAFHVFKQRRPDTDGCNWTLGVGLAWHHGKLYASYGFNKGYENTASEEAHVRVSEDGGTTWGPPVVIDAGEGNLGVSHGVFLSQGDRLWAFMGAFYDTFQKTHTRGYVLDEASGKWEPRGVVVEGPAADGVIVGSALVRLVADSAATNQSETLAKVERFVTDLASACG